MQRISVLIPSMSKTYDYDSEFSVQTGDFIKVPFGRKEVIGIVWDDVLDKTLDENRIKKVIGKENLLPLSLKMISFIKWVSWYTLAPVGGILKMALLPDLMKKSRVFPKYNLPDPDYKKLDFSVLQSKAIRILEEGLNKGFQVILLDGVTGSGKTEVYFETMAQVLRGSGQILVLLPEIALTTAWLKRFEDRFGVMPSVWHSSLTPKQRRDTWHGVQLGKIRVVVGARSSLFLPFKDLKLIIVDEEHDSSFKQEEGIVYHARDMAIVRAKFEEALIILSSATPSVETHCNALSGKYKVVELPNRFSKAQLPKITLIDMRHKDKKEQKYISAELLTEIQKALEAKEQVFLFINRRGYAPLVLCHACGHKIACPNCSVYLTQHKSAQRMVCHHCGYTRVVPKVCPSCQAESTFVAYGIGSERIFEEVEQAFPDHRIALVNSDTMSKPQLLEDFLHKMENGEIDIVIGTQILAKGHHFPNLTCVGVIDADMTLQSGDLRASERTFQLLHQVMGRSGRGKKEGRAFLQTYEPDNLILQALQKNDRACFLSTEVQTRQMLNMPPFGKLASILVSGKNELRTQEIAQMIVKKGPFIQGIDILGPTLAPLSRIKRKYRWRILVKAELRINLQNILHQWLKNIHIPSSINMKVDIDPYNFS